MNLVYFFTFIFQEASMNWCKKDYYQTSGTQSSIIEKKVFTVMMLFPLHQEGRLSQNCQVDSSNGWVFFKMITLTIFPSRPQENLNIGSSDMPIFCLINPEIIACIVKVIVCVCNGASFVEGRVKRGWDPNSKHLAINEETKRPMLQIIFGLC